MKNRQIQQTFLEMRQKLMQRFLDGALDQASYERLLADIESMEQKQRGYMSDLAESMPADVSCVPPRSPFPDASPRQDVFEVPRPVEEPDPVRTSAPLPAHSSMTGQMPPPVQTVTLLPAMPSPQMQMSGTPFMVPGMVYENGQVSYAGSSFPLVRQMPMPVDETRLKRHPGTYNSRPGLRNGRAGKDAPSPEIAPEVIKSLAPGQPLEIWWHYPLTQQCAEAWEASGVPIKLSLTMNNSVTDASLQCLAKVKRLCELNLTSTPASDEGLASLAGLPELESLILTSTRVEGKACDALATLENLRELTLTSSPFCDQGMKKIASMKKLEMLKLDDTQVTDEGLHHLSMLESLRFLNLQGSIISDAGLKYLADLTTLEKLYIGGTIPFEGVVYESPISNVGISYLRNLVNMRTLHLNDTQLTDSGVASLQKMERLAELNLADTAVTDSCLVYLRRMDLLRSVMVDGTQISLSGIRKVLGARAVRRFHGATVGAWRRLGSFLSSPWSRKN